MLEQIFQLIFKRWYVFTFLIAFLGVATYHWGWKRTLKFLVLGYFIAWASEASSIRNGFPYGYYQYRYENMQGEIFFYGVPIWDSLSYVFLNFAGWMSALFFRSRWNPNTPLPELQRSFKTLLLGALLTMIIDVVIDPVANLGSKWFLGNIYYYPHGGWYFGGPLSNFGGWFLVSLAILGIFRLTDKVEDIPKGMNSVVLGLLLYLGVYSFNLGITIKIGAYPLAAASAGWGVLLLLLSRKAKKKSVEM